MKSFSELGYHRATLTTTDDPNLDVVEIDDGISWSIKFYAGNILIDVINMEYPISSYVSTSVLNLSVKNDEGKYVGTVRHRLKYALDMVTH